MAAPAVAVPQPSDRAFDRAAKRIIELAEAVQQVPGASPALAVVIVRRDGPPRIWVKGKVRADESLPAQRDTPFYIASMTKAYVGLLAAELDRRGMLPLDTRLDAIWPGLAIPDVPHAGEVTLRQLLSHRIPFRNEALSYRTAYTDEPAVAAYRELLEHGSQPQPPDFTYSNLGYLIYGAAVEQTTGHHWRDLLTSEVLRPLRLRRTTPYTSRLAPRDTAGGHQWLPGSFALVPVKPDALMHAAGGLVASPGDMARWLQAWLRGRAGGIPASSFAKAAAAAVKTEGRMQEGIPCPAYSLGWNICRIGGAELYAHGGGYTGFRSSMAWSHDLDAGVAVLSNSDSMTGWLSNELTRLFFSALAEPDTKLPQPSEFARLYEGRVRQLTDSRQQAVRRRIAEPEWRGWLWKPSEPEVAAFAGIYAHPTLGQLSLQRDGKRLSLRSGMIQAMLAPAAADLFGVVRGPLDPPEPVRFERDAHGRVIALLWNEDRFMKAETAAPLAQR